MVRFDARRLQQGKDGDDFRDFVGELLRASPGFGVPIPRDSGSVDGGIDLYCEKEGLVVECKSVSSDVKDESARVDQEWRGVRDKLDDALVSEEGRAAPVRAPYDPWADAERPIKRYIFSTSARLANEAAQRDLATTIEEFFRDVVAIRPGYGHLSAIKVEVIDWTNIEARLDDHPALVFKWLKQWPSGFRALDDRSPTGFRAFLHNERLLYLARDSWQPPVGLRHAWTETTLVEDLTQTEARDAIVILIGQGGAGKTRLGLECARRMQKDWWTIHCDGLRATTAGLRQLLQESSSPTRLLLFVDYLETWPAFEAFANDVVDLNQSSGHQIRMIATCRASYRDRIPSFVKPKTVGGDAGIEVAYSQTVTRHILSNIGVADVENLAEKCHYNFALAAFLLFLKQERPKEFVGEISELRAEPSFEAWIVKRLQNSGLKNLNVVAAILAACEFPVTAFDALAGAHGGEANDLRRVLVADRWIERRESADRIAESPLWATFHDVFADVVLGRVLETTPDRDDAIDRLLERAVANGVFRQTLTALGRLKQIESLAAVDWRARLLELERRSPDTLAGHAAFLLANTLLSPETRLGLIVKNEPLREAIAHDSTCDVGLALVAVTCSKQDATQIQMNDFEQILLPLLDAAIAHVQSSNLVLRLVFNARPNRYREAAQKWISTHTRLFQTHFLLKAWLDQAVEELKSRSPQGSVHVDAVREAVCDWLAVLGTLTHASFVLVPWLNAAAAIRGERAAAMVAVVEGHVTAWLAHGGQAESAEARFVYNGWLDAAAAIGGERAAAMVAVVESHVTAWLAHGEQAESTEARFVYKGWLDAAAAIRGERAAAMVAVVEGHVTAWLARGEHAVSAEAEFVYNDWLDAAAAIGGERAAAMVAVVEDHVTAWLAQGEHAVSAEARFVYKSWLDTAAAIGGERAAAMVAVVEGYVTAWLAHGEQAVSTEAQFVYKGWLDAVAAIGGERAAAMVVVVEDHVTAWLAQGEHAVGAEARFVYKSWLDTAAAIRGERAAAMVAVVEGYVTAWLAHGEQAESAEAKFVYNGWLDAAAAIGGERAVAMVVVVEGHVTAWLALGERAVSAEAGYVYKGWLEAAGEAQQRRYFNQALAWILAHQDDEDCDVVLEPWLDKQLEFNPIAEPCFRAVRRSYDKPNGTFILKHVVRKKNLPEDVVLAALCWCALFPDHEDALNRLGPLISFTNADTIGAARLTQVTARVLSHQDLNAFIADRSKIAAARATLGSLFNIGESFPRAEKLARIYLVRWLRDGRIFRPAPHAAHSERGGPIFDQRFSIAESLLTLMKYGEFVPSTNRKDKAVLAQFCDWVGQWREVDHKRVATLIDELTDQYGQPDIWQRMLLRDHVN